MKDENVKRQESETRIDNAKKIALAEIEKKKLETEKKNLKLLSAVSGGVIVHGNKNYKNLSKKMDSMIYIYQHILQR